MEAGFISKIKASVFFFLFCLIFTDPSLAQPLQEVKVGIAVTPSFKADPEWKSKVQKRLAYASKIFETEFQIRFTLAEIWDWNVGPEDQDSYFLLNHLMKQFPLSNVDAVIGFSRIEKNSIVSNAQDFDVLGRTQPFSGYLLVRYPLKPLYPIQEETVLTHELGHLFGAVHSASPDTLMSPIVRTQLPVKFDEVNHQIILLTRTMSFKKGMAGIDLQTAQRLLNAYLRLMAAEQPFDFYYALGGFYLRLGQDQEALRAFKAARDLDPKNGWISFDLGVLYWKMGLADQAISELIRALSVFDQEKNRSQKIAAYKILGAAYFQKKKWAAAYDSWSSALVLDPKDRQTMYNMAVVQMELERYDDALRVFQQTLKLDPTNPSIISNIGSIYFRKGNKQQAIVYLEQALKAAEGKGNNSLDVYEIHTRLGLSYFDLKQIQAGFNHLEAACHMRPSLECHQKLGELYLSSGNAENAIRELSGVLSIRRDDPQIYGLLGVAFTQMDQYEKAISVFQEGLKYTRDRKTSAGFYKNIGGLYLQAGQVDGAIQAFQKAIENDWNRAESHMGLALAYMTKNRAAEARQSLKNVLLINPSNPDAKEILSKLDKAGL